MAHRWERSVKPPGASTCPAGTQRLVPANPSGCGETCSKRTSTRPFSTRKVGASTPETVSCRPPHWTRAVNVRGSANAVASAGKPGRRRQPLPVPVAFAVAGRNPKRVVGTIIKMPIQRPTAPFCERGTLSELRRKAGGSLGRGRAPGSRQPAGGGRRRRPAAAAQFGGGPKPPHPRAGSGDPRDHDLPHLPRPPVAQRAAGHREDDPSAPRGGPYPGQPLFLHAVDPLLHYRGRFRPRGHPRL